MAVVHLSEGLCVYTCGLRKGSTMQVTQATGQPFENKIYLEFVSEIFTWIVCWKHLILIKRGWGRKYIFFLNPKI